MIRKKLGKIFTGLLAAVFITVNIGASVPLYATEGDEVIKDTGIVMSEVSADNILSENIAVSSNEVAVSENVLSENGVSENKPDKDVEESAGSIDDRLSGNRVVHDTAEGVIQAGGFPKTVSGEEAAGAVYGDLEEKILAAAENWDGSETISIEIENCDISNSSTVFEAVDRIINNHPELFILEGSKTLSENEIGFASLILDVNTEYSLTANAELDNKVKSIVSKVDSSWTDLQKMSYIHDWLVTNVQYDLSYSKYTAYDAIVGGSSVCQGYALAYDLLMTKISSGYNCQVITSNTLNHAWNMITLNGSKYYVDCTWDDPVTGSGHYYKNFCKHSNFMISKDALINTGHTGSDWKDESGNPVYNTTTGNMYDSAPWIDSRSRIPMIGNKGAYCLYNNGSTDVYVGNIGSSAGSKIFSGNFRWYVSGSGGSYYTTSFSALDSIGDYFVLSSAEDVYLLDSTGKEIKKYSLTSNEKSGGYIYGIKADGGIVTYDILTEYDDATYVRSGTIDWSSYYNETPSEDDDKAVKGVSLDKTFIELAVGETDILTATVTPSTAVNKNVSWKSSNTSVAKVDSSGTVTAVNTGEAEITVTTEEGGYSETCSVIVSDKEEEEEVTFTVTFIDGGKTVAERTVQKGKTVSLAGININEKSGTVFRGWYEDNVTLWNASYPVMHDMKLYSRYASLESNGGSGSGKDKYMDVTSDLFMVKGGNYILDPSREYTSEDAKIVRISAKYKARGVKEGSISITDNNGNQYNVVVIDPVMSLKRINITAGETADLSVNLKGYQNDYDVTWESSNETVATYSAGKVTALSKGKAIITAYVGGKAYKCTVVVKNTYVKPNKLNGGETIKLTPGESYLLRYNGSDGFTFKNASWSASQKINRIIKNKKTIVCYETPVVNISLSGKLTAVGEGSITLKATDKNSISKIVTVVVTNPEVKTVYVKRGKKKSVVFQGIPSAKATWSTASAMIATVTRGAISGINTGGTDFTAKFIPKTYSGLANGYQAQGVVYVEDLKFVGGESGSVIPTAKNKSGTAYSLTLNSNTVRKINLSGVVEKVKWTSANSNIAFIDDGGCIYARNKGKTKINTKVCGTRYTITVVVQ